MENKLALSRKAEISPRTLTTKYIPRETHVYRHQNPCTIIFMKTLHVKAPNWNLEAYQISTMK